MLNFTADAFKKAGQVTADAYSKWTAAFHSTCTVDGSSDEDRYKMDYPSIGTCVIINNKIFNRQPTRSGTNTDAESAEETFKKLGYDVKVQNDKTVEEMKTALQKVSREDHSDRASFVCVILSHGDQGVIYGTNGRVPIQDLTCYFKGSHCQSLVGKPKLFFIQACRGRESDLGVCVADAVVEDSSEKLPVEADFLYAYSTAPGYFSWRNTSSGSWFIQSLCEMLQLHYEQKELMQIMVRVNRKVALKFESRGKKQMPCIVMMLTKELYFPKQRP